MTRLDMLVTATLADPLAAARVRTANGGRAIALVGAEVPIELVLAAGALPVQLPVSPPRPTPDADRYLERGFSPAVRLVLQDWIEGALDGLDAIVLSRSSDNAQRLYYYACELRRRGLLEGPEPLLYDLAKIDRATSVAHTRAATAKLAARLGAGDLAAAIAKVDRRRALFGRVQAVRPAWRGTTVERLLRASGRTEFDAFDEALEAALDDRYAPAAGPRVLLAGSSPPDERLHCAVEEAGGAIVAEFHEYGLDRHGPGIGHAADPIAAIADAYRALALGTRSFTDRAAMLRDAATRARADGVIFWLIEEEEALIWDLPEQIRAIEAAGLPALVLTRADWLAGAETLDAIAAFTRNLETMR